MIQISHVLQKTFCYLVISTFLLLIFILLFDKTLVIIEKIGLLILFLTLFITIVSQLSKVRDIQYDKTSKLFILKGLFSKSKVELVDAQVLEIINYKSLKKSNLYTLSYNYLEKKETVLFYKSPDNHILKIKRKIDFSKKIIDERLSDYYKNLNQIDDFDKTIDDITNSL